MHKTYYRRVEGPHSTDGIWQRHNSQYDDDTIMVVDYQDDGETLKTFKVPAHYIKVKLLDGVKCYLGGVEIEEPHYFAPDDVEVGMWVYVPIGKSRFNKAEVVAIVDKEDIPFDRTKVRAIDRRYNE